LQEEGHSRCDNPLQNHIITKHGISNFH
jgi:hypothetical protein